MKRRSRKKKIELLKFWAYNPATRSPFEVILAIGMTVSLKYHKRTEVGYFGGTISYTRNHDDEVEVAVDEVGSNLAGCYESSCKGKIDFTLKYRDLKTTQFHDDLPEEEFPDYQTPRVKWVKYH